MEEFNFLKILKNFYIPQFIIVVETILIRTSVIKKLFIENVHTYILVQVVFHLLKLKIFAFFRSSCGKNTNKRGKIENDEETKYNI